MNAVGICRILCNTTRALEMPVEMVKEYANNLARAAFKELYNL